MHNDEQEKTHATRKVKHDVKNQLSNITLALEQLRYEVGEPHPDITYYFDTIFLSCQNINNMINDL